MYLVVFFDFFFFKQKTAYEMRISDWSSDVCSSDLIRPAVGSGKTGVNATGYPEGHYALSDADRCIPFSIPGRNARGRIVRLGPVLHAILSNHNYPPLLTGLLAEALPLTALPGSTQQEAGGQPNLQARAQGGRSEERRVGHEGVSISRPL